MWSVGLWLRFVMHEDTFTIKSIDNSRFERAGRFIATLQNRECMLTTFWQGRFL